MEEKEGDRVAAIVNILKIREYEQYILLKLNFN